METHHNDDNNNNSYDNVMDFLKAKSTFQHDTKQADCEQYDEAIYQSNVLEDHLNKVLLNIIKVRMNARSLKTSAELDW